MIKKTPPKQKEINLNVEWDAVPSNKKDRGYGKTVHILTFKTKKELVIPNKLIIKIGSDVAKKLNWKKGDSICSYTHPDNAYLLKLVKSNGGNGWTLGHNNNDSYLTLAFNWRNPQNITLEGVASGEVNWQIIKEALIFNIYE